MRANGLSLAAGLAALACLASLARLMWGIGPRVLGYPGDIIVFPLFEVLTIAALLRAGRRPVLTLIVGVPILLATLLIAVLTATCGFEPCG